MKSCLGVRFVQVSCLMHNEKYVFRPFFIHINITIGYPYHTRQLLYNMIEEWNMKRYIIAILCICLLAAASVASAQEAAGYKVTYVGNNCLASVPTDEKEYKSGELVNVMFDPVTYMNGLIFYGWDWNNDGIADFGYAYNTFNMPAKNVEMKAICISPYYEAPKPGPRPPFPGPHPQPPMPPAPQPHPFPGQVPPAPQGPFGSGPAPAFPIHP